MNRYPFGNRIKIQGTFTNTETGELYDPTPVKVSTRAPNGVLTTKVYGTDAEVVRVSLGVYKLLLLGNQTGTWYYRWFCDDANEEAAEEERFYVENAVAD